MKYNNPAGRLLFVFERLPATNGQQVKLADAANAFCVVHDWNVILDSYGALREELQLLREEVEEISGNKAKQDIFRNDLEVVDKSLKSFTFSIANNYLTFNLLPSCITALRYMAVDFEQETEADADDLTTLRGLVGELQTEIENSKEFTKSMKVWLLDLVRIIRDSIDRYAIRGSKGMRQQYSLLLGELMQNYADNGKVAKTESKVWRKLMSAIDVMGKIVSLADKLRPAVTFGQKMLPHFEQLGLPSPDAVDP